MKKEFRSQSKKGSCESEIFIPETIKAPIEKGQVVGNMIFTIDGKEVGEIELITCDAVEKKSFTSVLYELFLKLFK